MAILTSIFHSSSQGVSYCITIFIADTTSLINRPLMLAFATSPYIVTTWIGGPMAEAILLGPGWRWGFGIFTIITPIVVLPLCFLFLWNERKARRAGLIAERGPLTLAAMKKYFIEADVIGIVILAAGMSLFLLPFNIYSRQPEGWRSPMIICMIIFGSLLIICFILYEKYLAPVKFIRTELLADRTVLFGGMMVVFVFCQSYVWGSYFTSMLLAAWNTGATKATYISNIYRVGSCFSGIVLALGIRYTGRFKWVALYFGLPMMMLGVGLMIHFRHPGQEIGYIVMTQIFVAFAGGPLVIAAEMAMMTPLDHQYIAAIIAILDLFGSVGTALGFTISAAIWTTAFKNAVIDRVPPTAPAESIYNSLIVQLGYPWGTEIRHGIALAYGDAQRYMLITSVCLLACAFGCAALWRDLKIKDVKQTKGNVV
jgi:hypothetical protein